MSRPVTKFHDLATYLRYAVLNGTSPASTVFSGTVYELGVLALLQQHFKMELQHFGGAHDNGRDLGGVWDVGVLSDGSISDTDSDSVTGVRVRGRLVKPLVLRKSPVLDVVVQCKCFNTKITAKEVRELQGIVHYNATRARRATTLGVLCAPSTLTKQGLQQLDRSEVPMMFCQATRLKGVGYDIGGHSELAARYLNPLALALLRGTSLAL